jgi:photoactive yellow protein
MSTTARTCAHCKAPLPDSSPPAQTLCADCTHRADVFPVQALEGLTPEAFDALPFGVVELDPEGVITAYNRAEERLARRRREEVLGRNFFTEVAPCTNVQEFAGRFREMVASGAPGEEGLEFVFRFPHGTALVQVQLVFSAVAGRGYVLVQRRA